MFLELITDKNGNTFKYFFTRKNWHAAKSHCEILGGNLATVEYKEKNFELKFWLTRLSYWTVNSMWLGYSDHDAEGMFIRFGQMTFNFQFSLNNLMGIFQCKP